MSNYKNAVTGSRPKKTVEHLEDLEIFGEARRLTNAVYEITRSGPLSLDVGLQNQLRRTAVSVMSNVAEGFERDGDNEFGQFLAQAKGSCGELRAQLYVARDQEYLPADRFDAMIDSAMRISRMISRLMTYLADSPMRGRKFARKKAAPNT